MNAAERRKSLSGILLFLMAFTLVGHVCVLPFHSHAESPAHDVDTSHHGTDDSVHDPSCEAVRSASPICPGIGLVAAALGSPRVVDTGDAVRFVSRPHRSSTSRLFLLHAALLI